MVQCWPTVCDAGPASNQHWFNASCLLGCVQPSKHKYLYTFVQCWANVEDVGPALYKCYTKVLYLLGIATGLVLLNTAGGDYKPTPTPTQCLFNVGPALPVLASMHSVLVSTSCCGYLHAGRTVTMLWTKAGSMLARRLCRWLTFSMGPNTIQ